MIPDLSWWCWLLISLLGIIVAANLTMVLCAWRRAVRVDREEGQ